MTNNVTNSAACAKLLGLELNGENIPLFKPSKIDSKEDGVIKFASAYSDFLLETLNSTPKAFVIAAKQYRDRLTIPHVLSDNPRLDFCRVTTSLFSLKHHRRIETSASICGSAKIGINVYIGHNVVIEDGVTVGDNTVILHNVVISAGCQIGSNCLIKSGTVIGQRGFGFERDTNGVPVDFTHYGKVTIGNYVEIGALNTVVAGALSDTVIEDHVKTDDHVHIAHNVRVRRGAFITACAEISGSVDVGEQAWLGPNCSIIDKASIGAKSFVGIGAVVTKSVPENVVVAGNPGKVLRSIEL